jgi:HPt (histidine-containing phosphotransfer) domain-containing protein
MEARPSGETDAAIEKRGFAALDLAHLARQCLGDHELEAELLLQFRTQALRLAAELAEDDRLPPTARADVAHRLKGSALAVGAPAVAHAAEAVEACGRAGGQPDEMSQAIARLTEAVSRAAAEIARLRT